MKTASSSIHEHFETHELKTLPAPQLVTLPGQKSTRAVRPRWTQLLLSAAGLNCLLQIVWFWRFVGRNINYDAISYIGIARHLAEGDFRAALHGYWSPLISWCIAAASFFTSNFLLAGRVVTIASFLLCLPVLYHFTLRLWQSSTLAALSVLCFTLCRGTAAFSVSFIGADFLLTAAILCYFTRLLQCLESGTRRHWLFLGAAHAMAFLAKAFAMPWLTVSTLIAAVVASKKSPHNAVAYSFAGLAIPLIVWLSWSAILETKYGHFTAGYQSKWNLLDDDAKTSAGKGQLSFLSDTSRSLDGYMVSDNIYPGSPLWTAQISYGKLAPQVLRKELHNLPEACRQVIILVTPGGILAFCLGLMYRLKWKRRTSEAKLAWIVTLNAVTLVLGYCMLVFDGRYVLPLAPLLIAFAVRFLVPSSPALSGRVLRLFPGVLFIASTIFLLFYWASPFRGLRRDYQAGVYSIAADLKHLPSCRRLVVIGKGPFPEHGVGWEAGMYASYFAGCRVVGFSEDIPSIPASESAIADMKSVGSDSILILGKQRSGDRNYENLLKAAHESGLYSFSQSLSDPEVGAIGELLWKP